MKYAIPFRFILIIATEPIRKKQERCALQQIYELLIAPENGKESQHSVHANGLIDWIDCKVFNLEETDVDWYIKN
jgi:hypothetical protein